MNIQPNLYCYATPCDWNFPHAIQIHITPAARAKLDKIERGEDHQKEFIVARDKITRKFFAIRHHPCWSDSWECCCAAQAQPVESKYHAVSWPEIEFLTGEDEN